MSLCVAIIGGKHPTSYKNLRAGCANARGKPREGAAVERREAELVLLADAAVVVCEDRDPTTRRLRVLLGARELPD